MEGHRGRAWRETRLWIELKGRADAPTTLTHALEGILPDVEEILDHGDTMPGNFTLHDSRHSWRVAEWMASLAGDLLAELSPYDLAMLLLSAYLHDIGMTPPLGKVRANRRLLLKGNAEGLSEKEAAELQAWLDDNWDGLTPPISGGDQSDDDLRLADQVVAGYVRHRHNDWSEEWIRGNLVAATKRQYPGFLDDLVLLCKSHHFGIDELRARAFNPRLIGDEVLHRRYCACLLRVADVLDFDPERTPPILFAHRDVGADSAIFWHKDHEISLVQEGNHLVLEAFPRDALTHHAIEMTVEAVDQELAGCRRLADEMDFHRMANREEDLPHRWPLDSSVKAKIEPEGDAYEYIDGTFRPDPQKLIELVGGIELYGSEFAALREVLQNAFDAVREQIARERLTGDDPGNAEITAAIARTHKVTLTLLPAGDGLELSCRDTGTGMSREVIRSRFLVGGTTGDHDIRALERACEEHGFTVGRTARFGIGVLSYFLLASDLTVHTRRSSEAGADGPGWTFTTSGLADFGELKQVREDLPVGTEVVLGIQPELLGGGVEEFARKLSGYLHDTVVRTPCPFSFDAPEFDISWSTGVGWVDQSEVAELRLIVPTFVEQDPYRGGDEELELMPREAEEKRDREERHLRELREHAKEALRITVHEGDLPDGLGSYRIYRGHFDLSCGPSFAYLDLEQSASGEYLVNSHADGDAALPMGETPSMSWNGMSVQIDLDVIAAHMGRFLGRVQNIAIDIDWASDAAGRLAVNRNSFRPSEQAEDAVTWVLGRAGKLLSELVSEHADSPLALLNASQLGRAPEELRSGAWLTGSDDDASRHLQALRFPMLDAAELWDRSGLCWRGSEVTAARWLKTINRTFGERVLSWHGTYFKPTAVGAAEGNGLRPVMIWESLRHFPGENGEPLSLAGFPPQWADLAGVSSGGGVVDLPAEAWNSGHPLTRVIDDPAWQWVWDTFGKGTLNPLSHRDELFRSPGRVAAWVLRCIQDGKEDTWKGLADRSPDLLTEAWARIPGLADRKIVYWAEERKQLELLVVGIDSWEAYSGSDAPKTFAEIFEAPSEEWWLAYADGERELKRRD